VGLQGAAEDGHALVNLSVCDVRRSVLVDRRRGLDERRAGAQAEHSAVPRDEVESLGFRARRRAAGQQVAALLDADEADVVRGALRGDRYRPAGLPLELVELIRRGAGGIAARGGVRGRARNTRDEPKRHDDHR
jgi:hypothetical protein